MEPLVQGNKQASERVVLLDSSNHKDIKPNTRIYDGKSDAVTHDGS